MKRTHALTVAALAIAVLVPLLPLVIGVWLPDVFIARPHTLASLTLTNGYRFQVVQYWNHIDFYSTELRITSPDGHTQVHTLDGDDAKSWRVPMTVDERRRIASVTLGGGRLRTVSW